MDKEGTIMIAKMGDLTRPLGLYIKTILAKIDTAHPRERLIQGSYEQQ